MWATSETSSKSFVNRKSFLFEKLLSFYAFKIFSPTRRGSLCDLSELFSRSLISFRRVLYGVDEFSQEFCFNLKVLSIFPGLHFPLTWTWTMFKMNFVISFDDYKTSINRMSAPTFRVLHPFGMLQSSSLLWTTFLTIERRKLKVMKPI